MIGNGGIIGPKKTPTSSSASGIWSLSEQQVNAGNWPALATNITVYIWGGGGAANGSGEVAGGPGAYVTGVYSWDNSTPITIHVAGGGVRSSGGARTASGGGGASAISISGTVLAVAAGGGGAGGGEQQMAGGVGGALNGGNGRSQVDKSLTGGDGATTSAAGTADTSGTPNGGAGSGSTGGAGANSGGVGGGSAGGWGYGNGGAGSSGNEGGGGGGGGYFGGGGGAYGSDHWGSGGGGGSSYTGGLTSASSEAGTVNTDAYNTFNATAPQTGNTYYGSNAAKPGWQANGGNGRVVIVKNGTATTFSYTGSTQTYTG